MEQPTAQKKVASHDNNVEAFMDDYIFYNILALGKSKRTCECNAEGNLAKQGHKAERIAPTATQDRATVNSVPELVWGYGWLLACFFCCIEFH